jgi:hypothetical protein
VTKETLAGQNGSNILIEIDWFCLAMHSGAKRDAHPHECRSG